MVIQVDGADPGWPLTDRLRRAREFGGFDQDQLAAELCVSKNTVSNYERGFTRPRRPMLAAWAMATGVSLAWLETDDASRLEIVRPKGLEPLTFWTVLCEHDDVLRCAQCQHAAVDHDEGGLCLWCPCGLEDVEPVHADDLALAA